MRSEVLKVGKDLFGTETEHLVKLDFKIRTLGFCVKVALQYKKSRLYCLKTCCRVCVKCNLYMIPLVIQRSSV